MEENTSEKTNFSPLGHFLFGVGELSLLVPLPSPPHPRPRGPQALSSTLYGWVSPLVQVVPYVTTIFGGLRAGKMVMLQGAVPVNARR